MADNYLERHREDYEKRKQAWLRKKRHLPQVSQKINKPEDESLQACFRMGRGHQPHHEDLQRYGPR